MKSISLRELHNDTGKWIRRIADEKEITITDRGVAIATVRPYKKTSKKNSVWANRLLLPGYAAYLRDGKMGTDSTPGISEDRTSRDNSVADLSDVFRHFASGQTVLQGARV
jgi:antitoxin (DNA-binding transcriptional repressor) of toxin-antitoxin stability system